MLLTITIPRANNPKRDDKGLTVDGDRARITGPDGSVIDVRWDDFIGGFQICGVAVADASPGSCSSLQTLPMAGNTIAVRTRFDHRKDGE